MSSETIFEVIEADDGDYCAAALCNGITKQSETVRELNAMGRDATSCFVDDPQQTPKLVLPHFVRDKLLAR